MLGARLILFMPPILGDHRAAVVDHTQKTPERRMAAAPFQTASEIVMGPSDCSLFRNTRTVPLKLCFRCLTSQLGSQEMVTSKLIVWYWYSREMIQDDDLRRCQN